jgi:hypothetical protein
MPLVLGKLKELDKNNKNRKKEEADLKLEIKPKGNKEKVVSDEALLEGLR